MTLFLSFVSLLGGLALTIIGSDKLVEGASALAKRLKVSDLLIGLTIVAFGTSAPELTVNLFACFQGQTGLAIGNAMGSNIVNTLLILGVAAFIFPIRVTSNTTWVEIPLSLLAALMLGVAANDVFFDGATQNQLTRTDGLALLGFFAIFMYYTFKVAQSSHEDESEAAVKMMSLGKSVLFAALGMLGLFLGGKLLVDGAIEIAKSFGMSDSLIGLTIVAIGTSAPELATSISAALKQKSDIAIGNVIGSNIFNIFFILGISSIINPLPFEAQNNYDVVVNIVASLLMFVFVFTGKGREINRTEGSILVLVYLVYMTWTIYANLSL